RLGKMRDHLRIEPIRLRHLPAGGGKSADLARIDHGERQACGADGRRHHRLETARRFDHDQLRRQRLQPSHQRLETRAVTRHSKRLAAWPYMDVQAILRYIDANEHAVLLPALLIRARSASHSTVRDQRTNGEGALLANGLTRPRSRRPPLRHRASKLAAGRTLDTRSGATKQSRISRVVLDCFASLAMTWFLFARVI